MRLRRRALYALVMVVSVSGTLASSGSAAPAADDVLVVVQLWKSGRVVPEARAVPPFKLGFAIDAAGGVIQRVTMSVSLPAGLSWGADGPDPAEGCQGTAPAVCTQELTVGGAGTVGGGWLWDVVANRPGQYEVTASVTPTEPDPNPSNNSHTLRFEVVAPPVIARTVAGAVKLSPPRPRAGSVVTATVRVSRDGAPVRPTRVSCTGAIGAAKVKGTARAASGTAACSYRTARSAKGRTLKGSIALNAGGQRFSRRFSTKLG
jgi:hypothetical protein